MIVSPGEGEMEAQSDHPLCVNPDSQWQTYFRDNEVLLQIDKDVRLSIHYIFYKVFLVLFSIHSHLVFQC